jgi:hypothetical protein
MTEAARNSSVGQQTLHEARSSTMFYTASYAEKRSHLFALILYFKIVSLNKQFQPYLVILHTSISMLSSLPAALGAMSIPLS